MVFSKRFIKFCIVGGSGIIVNEFFLWFLTEIFMLYYLISSLIAIEISIVSNYTLNNFWTFKDKKVSGLKFFKLLIKYNIVYIGGTIINVFMLWFFTDIVGIFYLFSNLIGMGSGVLWNYFFSLKVVWK